MVEQSPKIEFHQLMQIWSEERLLEVSEEEHLTEYQIVLLSREGGLVEADEELIEHLSMCPYCMQQWLDSVRLAESTVTSAAADDWFAGGMMEAASSEGEVTYPPSVSTCGKFELHMFTGRDDPQKVMVALEVLDVQLQRELEGVQVAVRNDSNVIFLEGRIIAGRLAREVDDSRKLSMASWSVVPTMTR